MPGAPRARDADVQDGGRAALGDGVLGRRVGRPGPDAADQRARSRSAGELLVRSRDHEQHARTLGGSQGGSAAVAAKPRTLHLVGGLMRARAIGTRR